MHDLPYVRLEANTRCYRCNGQLFAGQEVTVIWDEQIDGWKHKHRRRGLCHHRKPKGNRLWASVEPQK